MPRVIFDTVVEAPAVHALVQRVERGGVLSLTGIPRGAQPFIAALLQRLFPQRSVIVVAEGLKTQEALHQDITTWTRAWQGLAPETPLEQPPLFYPAWEVLPHEAKLPHADVISERLETLIALAESARSQLPAEECRAHLVVTSAPALLQRTFPPETLRARTRTLARGDRLDPLDLIEWLEEQGYEPEAKVSGKGEISLRGGILDIFPPTSPWPVRLEFFGEELESLRHFDPLTQVSREPIENVTLPPAGEIGLLKSMIQPRHELAPNLNPAGAVAGGAPSVHAAGVPASLPTLATLVDYLPSETLWLLCEAEAIGAQLDAYAEALPAGDAYHIAWDEFRASLEDRGMTRVELAEADAPPERREQTESSASAFRLAFSSLDAFRPPVERAPDLPVAEAQRREFFAQLHRWSRQDFSVHVFFNNEGERQRFAEIWSEYGLSEPPLPSSRPASPALALETHLGSLTCGFLFEEAKVAVVTDAEIFGRYKVQRPRRLKSPHAQTSRSLLEMDFSELDDGDYVVHVQHGIGRFVGLQTLPSAPRKKGAAVTEAALPDAGQECLVIEYAPRDPDQPAPRLYVPVSEAHLVSKYVGAGKARPPLNTLGGTRWQKTKEQAEKAVRDLAAELLSIQAARASQPGHAFPPDTPWQREFESAFLYEETPDQFRAIVQTKADLERPKPMDRLICGDVGYGKTEVAIRAAFKAVMGGKQVAMLVPTTILAQQHFNTFRERMADYPIRIEMLSRFRTRREQQKVIREVASGAVDIVIGTHRLIQDDLTFKELGLVVIDEEQRFGVLHKEKFKLLRKLVDVLTLSATPIPRTLYQALTGARDMSTIETPPQDRLPVETIVSEYDERVIRDAIHRELARGGQVFYLHNRVFDIDAVASRLAALVPKARLVVGHGQMDEDELEEVMREFVNGEADVLLSTTIIESGIDIPNANTIIIDRADRFGLSDLYQLRGRVGRYKHQAYAYLLIPRHAQLLSDARKRISAIRQYSSLGSGFRIAMRDLEIRGVGNLLGTQQSGHITAVGFDLYCQLLKQSVAALKGEPLPRRIEVPVRLDFLAMNPGEERGARPEDRRRRVEPELVVNVPRETAVYAEQANEARSSEVPIRAALPKSAAYLPLSYIADQRQRVEIYRKLAEVTDPEALGRLKGELRDRFGPLPPAVDLLLLVASLRLTAAQRGVTSIETKEDKLMLTRYGDLMMAGGKFPRLTKNSAKGRLNEIKRLLEALEPEPGLTRRGSA